MIDGKIIDAQTFSADLLGYTELVLDDRHTACLYNSFKKRIFETIPQDDVQYLKLEFNFEIINGNETLEVAVRIRFVNQKFSRCDYVQRTSFFLEELMESENSKVNDSIEQICKNIMQEAFGENNG